MIRGVLGSRASIGGVLGSGRGGAAAAWYLAGGVSAANCIAAYTPKGAASLAASYDNNAAPGNGLADGTYDAAPGVAPTWAAATGWTFANASSTYLKTGVTPTSVYTMIARYASLTNMGYLIGAHNAATQRYWMIPRSTGNVYVYGDGVKVGAASTSGVMAMAANTGYYNGNVDATTIGNWVNFGTALDIYIGNVNNAGSPWALNYISCTVQAIAIYNVTLDAATVAAISAAMAAL